MAVGKYINIARKLQTACNKTFDVKLLISTRQWYHDTKNCLVTQYVVSQTILNENGKSVNLELFKTYSQIQLVLFLRDFWYNLNGWEIPEDNKEWKAVKEKHYESTTTH